MILNVDETLLVLVPTNYCTIITCKWAQRFDSDSYLSHIECMRAKTTGYMDVVYTNRFINNVLSDIHLSD